MGLAETLTEAINTVREITLFVAADFSGEELLFQPREGLNHGLWLLGHLAHAQDGLVIGVCGEKRLSNPGYAKLFGYGTSASPDASIYPSREEILEEMKRIHAESIEQVDGMSDEALHAAIPEGSRVPPFIKTKTQAVLHMDRHEGMHCGQLLYLRRLMGKEPMI